MSKVKKTHSQTSGKSPASKKSVRESPTKMNKESPTKINKKSPTKRTKKSLVYKIDVDGTVEKISKTTKITFPDVDTRVSKINLLPSDMKVYSGDNDINVVNFDKKIYELLLSIDLSKLNDSRHSTGKRVMKESYHRDTLKKFASDMGIHNISLKDKLVEAILNKMEEYGINTNSDNNATSSKNIRK